MRMTTWRLLTAVWIVASAGALPAQPTPAGGEFQVNTTTQGNQEDAAVGFDAFGSFVVVWESADQDGDGLGIVARRFAGDATPLGQEIPVNTFTTFDQGDPAVAVAADGSFVVAWETFGFDGSGDSVQARRFDPSGSPLGDEFQVNTFIPGDQDSPAVAAGPDGGFIVVWESGDGQDGSADGVEGQRFDADGNPLGDEFQVNTFTELDQDDPVVAIDAAGRFVVVWESQSQDGSGDSVQAQLFAADGTPAGNEFQVNIFTDGDQTSPCVAADADGSFVVAWQSVGQDGDGTSVHARIFDAAGVAATGELAVNSFVEFDQDTAAVAVGPTGGFFVAWESVGPDGSGNGVQGQTFLADGLAVGQEVPVNTFTTGDQEDPAVAVDGFGNVVVIWDSFGQDGSGSSVQGQRFQSLLFADGFESGDLLAWSSSASFRIRGADRPRSPPAPGTSAP